MNTCHIVSLLSGLSLLACAPAETELGVATLSAIARSDDPQTSFADAGATTDEIVEDRAWYIPEANGTVSITVSTEFTGTKAGDTHFRAAAQFYSVSGRDEPWGEVIDPLDGTDDCGVRRDRHIGPRPNVEYVSVDDAVLIDDQTERPFELSATSNDRFYSYTLALGDLGVMPRFDGDYDFRANGGSFAAEVNLTGIKLPEALAFNELASTTHVERRPFQLTWTGSNSQPLYLSMRIAPQPTENSTYTLECLMQDDGEFTIPDAVSQLLPNGIARASFQRAIRRLKQDNGKAILTIGNIAVGHEFAYGDRCEASAVIDACDRYAEHMKQVYSECGREGRPYDELCPTYITNSCTLCPEYYECMTRTTTCTNGQLAIVVGCTCPNTTSAPAN